jgi:hypothetical protein
MAHAKGDCLIISEGQRVRQSAVVLGALPWQRQAEARLWVGSPPWRSAAGTREGAGGERVLSPGDYGILQVPAAALLACLCQRALEQFTHCFKDLAIAGRLWPRGASSLGRPRNAGRFPNPQQPFPLSGLP